MLAVRLVYHMMVGYYHGVSNGGKFTMCDAGLIEHADADVRAGFSS